MALVMNSTTEKVKVQALGNWFDFAPGQVKSLNDNLAQFLVTDKSYMGFVALPEVIMEDPTSEEAIKAKEEATKLGRQRRIDYLKRIIYNLEVSLARDMEMKNIKADPRTQATDGELKAYKELAAIKTLSEDAGQKRAEEIARLKGVLDGDSVQSDVRAVDQGSTNLSKSATKV